MDENPKKARFWRAVGISRMSSILEMVGRGLPKSNSIRLIVAGYGELGFMGCPQSCPGNTSIEEIRVLSCRSRISCAASLLLPKKSGPPLHQQVHYLLGEISPGGQAPGELRAIPYSGCGLAKRTDQVSDPSHGSRLKGQGPLPTCKPPGAPRSCVAAGGL